MAVNEVAEPPFDEAKMKDAVKKAGVPLEAEAFFLARTLGWRSARGGAYLDGEKQREWDILASRQIDFPKTDRRQLAGYVWMMIEAKWSQDWWVFIDLERNQPELTEYFTTKGERGSEIVENAVRTVADELEWDSGLPVRARSTREITFGYKATKNEQLYRASQQVVSALKGFDAYKRARDFSLNHRQLDLFAPVVYTQLTPVVARPGDGEEFEFDRADWVVVGSQL
jgi:hypothetical protein